MKQFKNQVEMKEYIKQNLSCKKFLIPSPKAGKDMYICPCCRSGTGSHKTGALKLFSDNTWYCFKCRKGGDVLNLIEEIQNINFTEAIKIACNYLGMDLSFYLHVDGDKKTSLEEKGKLPIEKFDASESTLKGNTSMRKANKKDYAIYYEKCKDGMIVYKDEVISYLNARGISMNTAMSCGLVYDWYSDPANAPGIAPWEHAGKLHAVGRLIIPTTGGYIGRRIDGIKEFEKMNSKGDNPGVFNSNVLYEDNDIVFVTEGAFDALSFEEAGASALSVNSINNTERLLELIKEKSTDATLVICFDNDSDSHTSEIVRNAAESLCSELKILGVNSIVLDIKPFTDDYSKDINDILVHNGVEGVKEIIDKVNIETNDLLNFFEKIQTESYKPFKTGIDFFDELLCGGIVQQSLLLLMAAPGAGKTALVQQISEEIAINGKKIIYLNFEMSREQMFARAISNKLRKRGIEKTALEILQGYKWTEKETFEIGREITEYQKNSYKNIKYNPDGITTDLEDILAYLNKVGEKSRKNGEDAPAIVIDYLHLISSKKRLDMQELIKQSVYGLKEYAKKYNTFVIAIVATNRESNRSGKININSGRDSSSIEYSGDYILSLNYYEIDKGELSYEKSEDAERIAEMQQEKWRRMIIRVAKSRLTSPGKYARCYFNAAYNTFYGEYDSNLPIDKNIKPFDSKRNKYSIPKW